METCGVFGEDSIAIFSVLMESREEGWCNVLDVDVRYQSWRMEVLLRSWCQRKEFMRK
jgi:hypothetical protein